MGIELKAPLVTVVITSYNYAKYIRDALESVSVQTYRPLECIVVDDCSTDNSLEIIDRTFRELREKNSGISYSLVSTGKNSGQLAAFLLGITRAKGVFINFLDADDILFPEFISTHVQVHLENLVAFTSSEPMGIDSENQIHSFQSTDGRSYNILGVKRNIRPVISFDRFRQNLQNYYPGAEDFITSPDYTFTRNKVRWDSWLWYPTSSALFRKSSLQYLFHADPEKWRICADILLFMHANIIGDSSFIPLQLSAYRRHGGNGYSLDAITGPYRYMTREKRLSIKRNEAQLPLSLIQIFSAFQNDDPDLAVEFMQTVIYQKGPKFLLKNWGEIFAYYPKLSVRRRLMILLKTFVRHRQLKKRLLS